MLAFGSEGSLVKTDFLSLGQRALPRCGSPGLAGHAASDQMTVIPQAYTGTRQGQVEGGTLDTDARAHPGHRVHLGRYEEHRQNPQAEEAALGTITVSLALSDV